MTADPTNPSDEELLAIFNETFIESDYPKDGKASGLRSVFAAGRVSAPPTRERLIEAMFDSLDIPVSAVDAPDDAVLYLGHLADAVLALITKGTDK